MPRTHLLSVTIKKSLRGDARRSRGDETARGAFALDVSFDASPGVTILFGASGAGKSLTLKSIAGLARPDAGRIRIGERVLFDSERGVNLPIRERGVGYVFQHLALLPHLSALENVEFALAELPRRERRERALTLLRSLGIEHAAARRPREISGGEAQRVALARALAVRPAMLLLDEPLSALDEPTKLSIISDLKTLNRELRLPIIYVTHSSEEAVALGERMVVLERGRVVAAGEPLKVFSAPQAAHVARLTGVENLFLARVVKRNEEAGTMTVAIEDDEASALDEDAERKQPRRSASDERRGDRSERDRNSREGVEARSARHLDVPLGAQQVDDALQVGVRSGDVLLATEEPRHTSARNIFAGRVASVAEGHARVVARVVCEGVSWEVSLTRQSAKELNVVPGREVWLAIKTHSCYLLDE